MCYWTALHAGHVRFSFVFCACKLFLDESSMAFIYFFYRQVTFLEYCKKVKGQLPPPSLKKVDRDDLHEHRHPFPCSPCTDAFLLKVGGLESMLRAGGWGRNSSFPNGTNPSSGLNCLLLKAVCLFNTYPILVHWITLE